MAIRLPLTTVLDFNDSSNLGATSTAGGVAKNFQLPQDTEGVVLKMTSSLVAGSMSVTLQTTDDGGTTWYDVARTASVTTNNNTTAAWLAAPTFGMGIRSTNSQAASTASGTTAISVLGTIGSAAASSLGVNQVSGLPILSQLNRVFIIYSGAITANDNARVQVLANTQAATA